MRGSPEALNYLARLNDLRGQVIDLIRDLPAEALNWRPVDATGQAEHSLNTLAILAAHTAGAEQFWVHENIAGYPKTRVRDDEFQAEVSSSLELIERHEAVGAETQKILEAMTDAELGSLRLVGEREVTVRWGIVHIIDHTALHLGHMQITFQLWNAGKAFEAPRWFQRR
jgi:hypothetical protein